MRHQRKIRRRFADQHGNRVFVLGTLNAKVGQLRLHRFKLRFRLGDIEPAGDARREAVARNFQCALVCSHGFFEQAALRIDHARVQIALHQQQLGAEPGCAQIGGAGGKLGLAGLDATPDAPPDIQFPIHRQRETVRRADRAGGCPTAAPTAAAAPAAIAAAGGSALAARRCGIAADVREPRCPRLIQRTLCLPEACLRRAHVLV